jgi:hypothetical protein
MDILSKLFGSEERVRIMRMFLFNPNTVLGVKDIEERSGASKRLIDSELAVFLKMGLIKKRPYPRNTKDKDGNKKKGNGWILDNAFTYLKPLENILIHQVLVKDQDLVKRFSKTVLKLKMVIIAGIFIQSEEARVDVLVVGDNLKKTAMGRTIKELESEIGKEIRYAAFETSEFQYRIGMYDKLLRDISDYPHKTIFDKISSQNSASTESKA